MPNRLSRIRSERGLTQEDFAKRCGVSRGTVSRWENDKFSPSERNLLRIADILGVEPDELRDADESQGEEPRYVSSKDDRGEWGDLVIRDREIDDNTRIILMNLPTDEFVDKGSTPWLVTVTVDEYVNETGRSRQMVEEHLPLAMESKYVERIGRVKYTARLKFPG